jgi:hypothetical protein
MEKKMASSSNAAPPAEAKSGVEVHWQSSIKTLSDGAAFMCMNELGADVFLKPMLNSSGAMAGIPKVSIIQYNTHILHIKQKIYKQKNFDFYKKF